MLFMNPDDPFPIMQAKMDLANCRSALALYPHISRHAIDRMIQHAYAVLDAEWLAKEEGTR